MERAFLLVMEFDGTDFCGWQVQPGGRSVQQVVEDALGRLAGSPRRATAAGRTDAGVHALAMPVTTAMPERWRASELLRALNAVLPDDVAVREVRVVSPELHARRSALGRRYRYLVGTDDGARSPFRSRTEWPLGRRLDLATMQRAAAALCGEHQCRAFAVVGAPKPHYRCRISHATWDEPDAGRARFTIAADRFLHHMVRLLVGTMVDIGLGRRPEEDMSRLLELEHNHETSAPAPASGLAFISADYHPGLLGAEAAAW